MLPSCSVFYVRVIREDWCRRSRNQCADLIAMLMIVRLHHCDKFAQIENRLIRESAGTSPCFRRNDTELSRAIALSAT